MTTSYRGAVTPAVAMATAALCLLVQSPCVAKAPEVGGASSTAEFVCKGAPSQTCHFSIIRQAGGKWNFTLGSGERRRLNDVAVGADRYMVSVNFSPPADPVSCTRVPAAGKRSAWCKFSIVARDDNN